VAKLQFLNKFVELHLIEQSKFAEKQPADDTEKESTSESADESDQQAKQRGKTGEPGPEAETEDSAVGQDDFVKIKAKIQFVNSDSIGLVCGPESASLVKGINFEQHLVFVDVYEGPDIIAGFSSIVTKHWVDPLKGISTLYINYPKNIHSRLFPAAERHKIKIPASLHIVSRSGQILAREIRQRAIPIVIRDISETGAQILSELRLSDLFHVSLNFKLQKQDFEVLAEIVWAQTADKYYLYGLRFLNIDLTAARAIRNLSLGITEKLIEG